MNGWTPASKLILFTIILSACVLIWDRESLFSFRQTVTETFDGDDPDLILAGPVDLAVKEALEWDFSVSDGRFVLENRSAPKSAFYKDIEWVRYDGSDNLVSTNLANISVTVTSDDRGRGGAGVFVGSGQRGRYWMFCIDGNGHYFVLNKSGRKVKTAFSGSHAAIHPDKANRVALERQEDKIVFLANDVEIIQVPMKNWKGKLDGVGLGAFGKGSYTFDDLKISQ
ncbi:hypothetical protein [Roseibium sp.]|uniref:hypothetical protein n=1 Tax=Roseibium sp. TaxID=1936156 RepID=UPI003A986930